MNIRRIAAMDGKICFGSAKNGTDRALPGPEKLLLDLSACSERAGIRGAERDFVVTCVPTEKQPLTICLRSFGSRGPESNL